MKRALLEAIVSGLVLTTLDVKRFVESTLLHSQQDNDSVVISTTVKSSLAFLEDGEFINSTAIESGDEPSRRFETTKLGQATVSSALAPEESLIVYGEITKALRYSSCWIKTLRSFILEDELHIVYQVTPTFLNLEPNWACYLTLFNGLSDTKRAVAHTIGIEEHYLIKASTQSANTSDPARLAIHKRFYAGIFRFDIIALMLNELIQEVPFASVMKRFSVNRGTLQSLQSLSSTFSGMVTVFVEKLGWANIREYLTSNT
jgi:DNA polymerase theta